MSSTIDTAAAHAALKIVIGKIKDRAPGEPIPWRECEDAVAAAIAVRAAPEDALAPIRNQELRPADLEAYLEKVRSGYGGLPPKPRRKM